MYLLQWQFFTSIFSREPICLTIRMYAERYTIRSSTLDAIQLYMIVCTSTTSIHHASHAWMKKPTEKRIPSPTRRPREHQSKTRRLKRSLERVIDC